MKLNPTCIRDIMFFLETNLNVDEYGDVCTIRPEDLIHEESLSAYQKNELMYHIKQLFESNILKSGKRYINDALPEIADITPRGHQLLVGLHNDTVWKKILSYTKSAGAIAIKQLIQLTVNQLAT